MFINTCYQSMSMFRREEGGRRYLYQHLLPEYYLACSEGGRRGRAYFMELLLTSRVYRAAKGGVVDAPLLTSSSQLGIVRRINRR